MLRATKSWVVGMRDGHRELISALLSYSRLQLVTYASAAKLNSSRLKYEEWDGAECVAKKIKKSDAEFIRQMFEEKYADVRRELGWLTYRFEGSNIWLLQQKFVGKHADFKAQERPSFFTRFTPEIIRHHAERFGRLGLVNVDIICCGDKYSPNLEPNVGNVIFCDDTTIQLVDMDDSTFFRKFDDKDTTEFLEKLFTLLVHFGVSIEEDDWNALQTICEKLDLSKMETASPLPTFYPRPPTPTKRKRE